MLFLYEILLEIILWACDLIIPGLFDRKELFESGYSLKRTLKILFAEYHTQLCRAEP